MYSHQIATVLSELLPIKIIEVKEITDLFSMLSNSKFCSDLIIVDIERLYRLKGADAFEIIDTISTIINCTVCRTAINQKPTSRTTKIAVTVDLQTSPKLIKEVIGTKITGLYPRGLDFTIPEKKEALEELLSGHFHFPKKIKDLISPSKQKLDKSDILLTPRQTQITALIQERGASNKVIAKMLNITESTVKLHITQIFKKYGVRNRTQLAVTQRPKPNPKSL
jgi:DNA-binding NarL/FixJ family response regulator